LTGTIGNGIGAGTMNTALIEAMQINDTDGGGFAANVAADVNLQEDGVSACSGSATETCPDDWYLLSKAELNFLLQQRGVVGGLATGVLRISMPLTHERARMLTTRSLNKDISVIKVRAV
jgi:hypothetical protein